MLSTINFSMYDFRVSDSSGYCWFLEKPLLNFKGYFTESELMIHKFADDWFLVRLQKLHPDNAFTFRYFKCDQIESVSYLLGELIKTFFI